MSFKKMTNVSLWFYLYGVKRRSSQFSIYLRRSVMIDKPGPDNPVINILSIDLHNWNMMTGMNISASLITRPRCMYLPLNTSMFFSIFKQNFHKFTLNTTMKHKA